VRYLCDISTHSVHISLTFILSYNCFLITTAKQSVFPSQSTVLSMQHIEAFNDALCKLTRNTDTDRIHNNNGWLLNTITRQ